jgi:hypothetical protein
MGVPEGRNQGCGSWFCTVVLMGWQMPVCYFSLAIALFYPGTGMVK